MGLSDFEKDLAESKSREDKSHRSKHRERDEDSERKHRHRHHHRSHRHRDDDRDRDQKRDRDRSRDRDDERRHRHKRHHRSEDDEERRRRKRQRSDSPRRDRKVDEVKVFDSDHGEEEEDEWVEKDAEEVDKTEPSTVKPQRDGWMQEPSAMDIEHVQSRKPKEPPGQFVSAKAAHDFQMPETQGNSNLADLQRDFDSDGDDNVAPPHDEKPQEREITYTFGDSGSSWRMTKLKAVYRQAEDSGKSVDEVALERYGDLQDFDDAREEEREMERRKMYGKAYNSLEKPSGDLYEERQKAAKNFAAHSHTEQEHMPVQEVDEHPTQPTGPVLDPTALNKLRAQMMKAKLRKAPNAAQLEEEYNAAAAASASAPQPDTIVLNRMENRQLAGGREGEVIALTNKRGRERGLVVENEDMTIEDMVRQERRSRQTAGGEVKAFAERIAKDGRFKNDLDYMDENASNLSKTVLKGDVNLRNTAISDAVKMQRILDSCPLCHNDQTNTPPIAPLISLGTRTYLTLPPAPELTPGATMIVPIQHRANLLACDDDEWEELRNFMKALTRTYANQNKGIIFYENALSQTHHAALTAIPLPFSLAEPAPMYFREALLARAGDWTQHKPIIDTLALSRRAGYGGKAAFRKALVKEMPYFHVWFSLDGGLGHVIEEPGRWPKGDLFAREVLGGMLDVDVQVVKRQGRWVRGGDKERVERFRKRWDQFDWTKALLEAA
ncbi:Hypothetical protein R9X50_00203300 [Acrodontium crateriforme]|uniref:Cell cycle control protein cwf19 n=1 Tax=Acrodontium crateriforme TaxID=150365 RepID=A0AAQ3M0R8_9PEZI|nr:Hypothetical protein R9X50_00203300 [Acrodontium crateriforme]